MSLIDLGHFRGLTVPFGAKNAKLALSKGHYWLGCKLIETTS